MQTKKITLATLKSFVRKNRENLYVLETSRFSGMSDMVEYHDTPQWHPAQDDTRNCCLENSLGVLGVWCVRGSRDYFKHFENENFIGINVYNCCGSFTVAIKKVA